MHGENICAYVTLEPGGADDAGRPCPLRPRPLQGAGGDRLPRRNALNATGKVDRVTLKKMAQEGTAAASGGQAQHSTPFREDRRR
jgi:hypothetical protein